MGADIIVLGAGIVGVCAALHLAQRGHRVTLVDRGAPGGETSFGNAGLIQSEGVLPRAFPTRLSAILGYGLNQSTAMHFHPTALPRLAPFLLAYWRASQPRRYRAIVSAYAPLIGAALGEHRTLIADAGASGLIGTGGWLRLYRTEAMRDIAFAEAEWLAGEFGIAHVRLDAADLAAREPALIDGFAGASHWTDPWTVNDPGALVGAYAARFAALGGRFVTADALALSSRGAGWALPASEGSIEAEHVVVALGPWAGDLTEALGYRLPLAVKRGYHMHYRPDAAAPIGLPMLDDEGGYLLAPMRAGIRLTTGVEFARRDARPTPVQVERAERTARTRFRFGERLEAEPWMGSRPATPDMLPVIGPAPRHKGLWFAFGHAHHGLTLGPVTGRLIAEMISEETPFIDTAAFSAARF